MVLIKNINVRPMSEAFDGERWVDGRRTSDNRRWRKIRNGVIPKSDYK